MKKAFLLVTAMTAFSLTAFPLAAQAKSNGNGKDHYKHPQDKHAQATSHTEDALDRAGARALDTLFTASEVAIIKSFFGDAYRTYDTTASSKKTGLPPGLAKRDRLPPGLEKQLVRKGHLPPGLEKRSLPNDLIARLPAPSKGTHRYIAGTDVLLVDTATNIVLDIIRDALTPQPSIRWNN